MKIAGLVFALFTVFLCAHSPRQSRAADDATSDCDIDCTSTNHEVAHRIGSAISDARLMRHLDTEIRFHQGQVTLTGYARSEDEKAAVAELIKSIPEVKQLRNWLIVDPNPPIRPVQDFDFASLQERSFWSEPVPSTLIRMACVVFQPRYPSQSAPVEAIPNEPKFVPDAKSRPMPVPFLLSGPTPGAKFNQRVAEAIAKALIDAELSGKGQIDICFKDGVVRLTGSICGADEKQLATTAAATVQGVEKVDNRLIVVADTEVVPVRAERPAESQ